MYSIEVYQDTLIQSLLKSGITEKEIKDNQVSEKICHCHMKGIDPYKVYTALMKEIKSKR
jgi:hypothetical protein